ncbi:MAG: DMT family transporter [Archangium sp.]
MTPPRPREARLATLALLTATAVWGGTFVTVKDALAGADTFTFLALRFTIGALTAAVLAAALARKFPEHRVTDWPRLVRSGGVLGLLLFGGYLLQTLGLERTTPARSAFVTGLTVIFVPFVAWRLERKAPPLRSFIAPFVAVFGLQQLTGVSVGDAIPTGDALTLGCAVLYAIHIALMSRLSRGLPPLALTALQLVIVAVLSTACLPFVERRFDGSPTVWFAIAFTGIAASALAIGAQVWAQARMTAVRAAVIYSLEPVFVLVLSALTGAGFPSVPELRGGALILLAVLISEVPLRSVLRLPAREEN